MRLVDVTWLSLSIAIIAIVLIVDPKSASSSPLSSSLVKTSAGRNLIYQISAGLIVCFYLLTIFLSYLGN